MSFGASPPFRRSIWAPRFLVFAVALVIRLGAIHSTGPAIVRFGDAMDYLSAADHVCRDHAYPDRGNLPFFRAPLLPAFIAAATLCDPGNVPAVKVGLALLDSLTAVVVAELAFLLFGSASVMLLAGLVTAVDPFFIAATTDVRTEPLFMFLLTSALWFLCLSLKTGRSRWVLLAGAGFGLAALTRPTALLTLAFVALVLVGFGKSTGAHWRLAITFVLGGGFVLLPWVIRNARRYHELILVNDAAGINFWRGMHPEMERIARIRESAEYSRAATAFETQTTTAMAKQVDSIAQGPHGRSHAWFAAGLENVKRDPAQAARILVRHAWRFWRPWLNPQEHERGAVIGSAFFNILLFTLGGIGLWRYRKEEPRVVGAVVAYMVLIWAAHLPTQVVMRFRIPFTDPLLIVFGSGAIIGLRSQRKGRQATSVSAA